MSYENEYDSCKPTHIHEYLGNVKAEEDGDPSDHRFSGFTGGEIPLSSLNHYHKLINQTDLHEEHFHIMCAKTGPGMCVGHGRHVHFVRDFTDVEQEHKHEFIFSTLMDNPTEN